MTRPVVVASIGGAPGVSTLVSAMAVASQRPLLVVECAPAGGVLATRWGWSGTTTLADLALEDTSTSDDDLWAAARPWIGATRLLPANPSAVTMRRSPTVRFVTERLETTSTPTLIDLGRLEPADDTLELLSRADRLWLLVDPIVEQVAAAAAWRPLLERVCNTEMLLAATRRGQGGYEASEVAATLDWPVRDTLIADRRAAAALRGVGTPGSWMLTRLPLIRQAGLLLDVVAAPAQQEVAG